MKRRTLAFPAIPGQGALLLIALTIFLMVLLAPSSVAADTEAIIIVNQATGGTISISPVSGPYDPGTPVTLTATPNPGWALGNWIVTPALGIPVADLQKSPLVFEVPEGVPLITVTAKFIFCHQLERVIEPADSGTIPDPTVSVQGDVTPPVCTPSPPNYAKDTVLNLKAIPKDGYVFSKWSANVTGTADLGVLTMTGSSTTVSATATFAKACRLLELKSGENGGDPTPDDKLNSPGCDPGYYKGGEVITFSASPDPGFKVLEWIGTNNGTNVLTFPYLPEGVSHTVTVNYVQKPTIQFSSTTYSVEENVTGGKIDINVTRSGNIAEAASVDYEITPGTATENKDYKADPSEDTLTFDANESVKKITIQILDDTLANEGNETVNLKLLNPSGNAQLGTNTAATLEIVDNESDPQLRFENADYEVDEVDTTLPVKIRLSPQSATKIIRVLVRTEPGTATPGSDYRTIIDRSIRFDPGDSSKTINLSILGDDLDEPDETFTLVLYDEQEAKLGSPSTATITIKDNDASPTIQLGSNEYFAQVGAAEKEILVTLSEASGQTVKVSYTIIKTTGSRRTDEGELTFAPGETTKSFSVDLAGTKNGDQFLLQLNSADKATLGSPSSATLYVLNTTPEDCRRLTFEFSGLGQAPRATNLNSSLGCPSGSYVAGELIAVTAQPAAGWRVARWQGTSNDSLTSLDNVVVMPDENHTVTADYLTDVFLPIVKRFDYFFGPNEEEPNNIFAEANGPLQPGKEYFGGFPDNTDREDRYFFQLTAQASVAILLDNIPSGRDYDIYLYDVNWAQGEIAISDNFDNSPENITITLEPGKYYARILPGSSTPTTAKYRLKVTFN